MVKGLYLVTYRQPGGAIVQLRRGEVALGVGGEAWWVCRRFVDGHEQQRREYCPTREQAAEQIREWEAFEESIGAERI